MRSTSSVLMNAPKVLVVRMLVEEDLIPDDVTILGLSQARDELLERVQPVLRHHHLVAQPLEHPCAHLPHSGLILDQQHRLLTRRQQVLRQAVLRHMVR